MRQFKIPVVACLALVAALTPVTADAFDDRGHRIVGLIAEHFLSPETSTKVSAILATDTDPLAPHDIAGAATWANRYMESDADTTRERFEGTRHWHFARILANRPNIPEACFDQHPLSAGTPASKGPAAACVIDKIDQFKAELSNPATSPAERLLALKYLLHFVGDVHAPMQVQDQFNDFGRLTPVRAADKSITPGTLYGYWNRALVHRLGADDVQAAKRIVATITPADREIWSGQVTHFWALEAHQLAVTYANGTMLGDYSPMDGAYNVSREELEKAQRIVERQIAKAGFRLAQLLNTALGEPSAAVRADKPKSNVRAGRALAERRCVTCHVVASDPTAVALGTTAPDFATVANTRGMSPVVLRAFLFGPHPTMPYLVLTEKEANDAINYIMSLQLK
jgi:mono/diheme cytochrome c family protein